MFRKSVLAIAATALIGAAALVPTEASAKKFGFGFGFYGFHGFHGYHGVRIITPVVNTCLRYRLVETRRGYLKRILVNVCVPY